MRVKKPRKPIELTCVDCGETFIAYSSHALRCPECRKKAKKQTSAMWMAEDRAKHRIEAKKIHPKMTIKEVLKELEIYNKANKTRLSYGQFVQKMEAGKL